jgi:hypothetical protein
MIKKSTWLVLLSLILAFVLTGCFSHRYNLRHNPDGSGLLTLESVFTVEYLGIFDEGITMEEAQDQILAESVLSADALPDDPNIRSIEEDHYIDTSTGALHHTLEIEIIDILQPILFNEGDETRAIFTVEAQGDGTYLFSAVLKPDSEIVDDEDDDLMMDPEGLRFLLDGSSITWEIFAGEFIDGDAMADYDPASSTVSWEVPMFDVLFGEEPVEIFAIYRLESVPVVEPTPEDVIAPTATATEVSPPEEILPTPEDIALDQNDQDSSGLPNWIPVTLAAVLCLGLIFTVIVIVVIILVVRSRKKPQV